MAMKLEIALVLDTSQTMALTLKAVAQNLNDGLEEIARATNGSISLALIEFKNHSSPDSVVKTYDFTPEIGKILSVVKSIKAVGGDEYPEAIADALYHCVHTLKWNADTKKFAVVVTDKLPQGIGKDDPRPVGCPDGHDPVKIIKEMAKKNISLIAIKTSDKLVPKLYPAMCFATGGRCQKMDLTNPTQFRKILVGNVLEDISMDEALKKILKELQEQVENNQGKMNEVELTLKMQAKMNKSDLKRLGLKQYIHTVYDDFENIKDEPEEYLKFNSLPEVKHYLDKLRRKSPEESKSKADKEKTSKLFKEPTSPEAQEPRREGIRKSLRLAELEKEKDINTATSGQQPAHEKDIAEKKGEKRKPSSVIKNSEETVFNEDTDEKPVMPELRRLVRKAVVKNEIILQ